MKTFLQWFSPAGTLSRTRYAVTGFLLFAIKYNVDRLVSVGFFDRNWFITDYFSNWGDVFSVDADPSGERFFLTMALTALPFVWIGTAMTIRRLRDIGLQLWSVFFFFLPFINLVFFLVLCLLPSRKPTREMHKKYWLSKIIPTSDWANAAVSVIITSILAVICGVVTIYGFSDYGVGLFIGIPFMQGLTAAVLFGYHKPQSLFRSIGVAWSSVLLFALLIFVLAVEGIICIAMAAPIGFGVATIGGIIGYMIQRRSIKGLPASLIIFAVMPLLSGVEHMANIQPPLHRVSTEIVINTSRQQVWNQLVTFNEMREPEELIFRSGIAYPIKAEIEGKGAGSVRKCVFTTGAFIEPIEIWDEPNLLKFSVEKVPPPLVELSIYDDLHLPHLEGYFTSEKGQFKLTALSGGRTLLQGTTWYRHDIWPGVYWKLWSDYILHTIHKRVLNHIKQKSEKGS
jgi:uncharacterized membrane protein YhaH (DUF805 family)